MEKSAILRAAARSEVYGFLALAFIYPDEETLEQLRARGASATVGFKALRRAAEARTCAAVLEELTAEALKAAHLACFGHAISKDCPPYEAEYGRANIFQKTELLADIAGFYRAFGLAVAPHFRDRPDHLAAELEFMEFLCRKEAYAHARGHERDKTAICRRAQRTFLAEHLGNWIFGFIRRLNKKAAGSVYAPIAGLLDQFLSRELSSMRIAPGSDLFLNDASVDTANEPDCARCPLPMRAELAERSLQR